MDLQLSDKQFLRSVADLVVNNPDLAKHFFNSRDIDNIHNFAPMLPIIEFLKGANEPIKKQDVVDFINSIKNNDVKEIFITALNMSNKSA